MYKKILHVQSGKSKLAIATLPLDISRTKWYVYLVTSKITANNHKEINTIFIVFFWVLRSKIGRTNANTTDKAIKTIYENDLRDIIEKASIYDKIGDFA